ncbi:MAG: hypothetical protein COZ46_01885 [Verrucomicrobia bacterium CG_4_10_14_3_um_filter_43_23]|nr:MAG: hypothetical protein COX01_03490 [Verrucomicrobia bacterium CG22_combo_CG10-13_8_21_14_all_43_17]PIX58947.1 MAG: hypothetical protein COZ46_01885 [Verrucomicrobia bacterium CG_4_10_14_3_um_filter_43_23]PIY63092.1 MAG: hypothetical protein COY94_00235 [Verrucomicrobia bacterium CG_4_10_14_0_8_um_filter_43_34]PJA43599.1 MAG: hypothetical protein CO175_07160 [Verrucomicrobia bacterium CG_4_9_14_3_um_filter_43_20]
MVYMTQDHKAPHGKKHHSKGESAGNVIEGVFQQSSFEDKLWIFLKNNKRLITSVIVVVVLLGLAIPGVNLYQSWHASKVQKAFVAAKTKAQQEAFVKANPNEILAAVTMLEFADSAYSEGDYKNALTWYQKSKAGLKENFLAGRARLGIGMATILSGNDEQGRMLLEEIVSDDRLMSAYRAEAAYHLALLLMKDGQDKAGMMRLVSIGQMPNAGIWQRRAMALRQMLSDS